MSRQDTVVTFLALAAFILIFEATVLKRPQSAPLPIPEWGKIESDPQVLEAWLNRGETGFNTIDDEELAKKLLANYPAVIFPGMVKKRVPAIQWVIDVNGRLTLYVKKSNFSSIGYKASDPYIQEGSLHYQVVRDATGAFLGVILAILGALMTAVIVWTSFDLAKAAYNSALSKAN